MNFVKIHQGFRSGNFVELYVSKIQVSTLISTCCWPVPTKSPCPVSTIQEVGRHEQFQSYFRGDGKFRDLGRAVCVTHLVCEVHAYFLKYVWSKKKKREITTTYYHQEQGRRDNATNNFSRQQISAIEFNINSMIFVRFSWKFQVYFSLFFTLVSKYKAFEHFRPVI